MSANVSDRRKLFRYLFLREVYAQQKAEHREQQKVFMAEKAVQRMKRLEDGLPPSSYPGYRTCFSHISLRQENNYDMSRLMVAWRLKRRLLIDCSFENEHKKLHLKSLADQIIMAMGYNKHYELPFMITLCNYRKDSLIDTQSTCAVYC
ncbi:hypothetical protein ACOME3_009297 [Neoechinorhynchus agilis]